MGAGAASLSPEPSSLSVSGPRETAAAAAAESNPELESLATSVELTLASVLQGSIDPLQVLFDGEAGKWTSEIYSRAPVARFYNALLTKGVANLIGALANE